MDGLSVDFDKDTPDFEREIKSGYVCTIINLMPLEINESKPHILPSTFKIPPAPKDGISVFHVGEGIHYIPSPFDNRSFKQTTNPMEMARSVCDDWRSSHIALGEGAEPGLFWVEGRLTAKEAEKSCKAQIEVARKKQNQWFQNLVAMADADWNKNHNMLSISSLQKMAADCLGQVRPWQQEVGIKVLKDCPFCKASIDPDSVKCFNCKEIVDMVKYKAMTGGAK